MKATEFRLGNLVNRRIIGTDKTNVVGVDVDVLKNITRGNVYFEYLPIPISEEKILEFGIFNLNPIETSNGYFFVDLKERQVVICGRESNLSAEMYYVNCQYIHQLQNLYFALTGEELVRKPKSE